MCASMCLSVYVCVCVLKKMCAVLSVCSGNALLTPPIIPRVSMSVNVNVCMCVSVCECVCVSLSLSLALSLSLCVCLCVRVCVLGNTLLAPPICSRVSMSVNVNVCVFEYVRVCVFEFACVNVCVRE